MDTTTDRRYISLALGILLVALGFFGGWCNQEADSPRTELLPPIRSGSVRSVRTHPDSASQSVAFVRRPLWVHTKATMHIASRIDSAKDQRDSLRSIACLDTILRSTEASKSADTIEVCYNIPQDSFTLSVQFAPRDTLLTIRYEAHDSLIRESDTIMLAPPPVPRIEKTAWYDDALQILGALFVGFLFGELKK